MFREQIITQPEPGVFEDDCTTYIQIQEPRFVGSARRDQFIGGSVTYNGNTSPLRFP